MESPPQNPDLNPIEHVQSEVDHHLRRLEHPPKNKTDLWEQLCSIWEGIEIDFVQKLISSMPTCVNNVVQAKGGYTRWQRVSRCCLQELERCTIVILVIWLQLRYVLASSHSNISSGSLVVHVFFLQFIYIRFIISTILYCKLLSFMMKFINFQSVHASMQEAFQRFVVGLEGCQNFCEPPQLCSNYIRVVVSILFQLFFMNSKFVS